MTKGILKQPETLPSFWKEEFERSLWPSAKRKRKQRCGCKKIHLLGLVKWSNGIGNKDHGGHLTTANARRVTCFICLERMFWDRYLKYPDEFPKDFVLSREKSMSLLETFSPASGGDISLGSFSNFSSKRDSQEEGGI